LSLTTLFGLIGNPHYLWSRSCPCRVPDGATNLLIDVRISAQFLHESAQKSRLNSATAVPFTHFNRLFIAYLKLHNPRHSNHSYIKNKHINDDPDSTNCVSTPYRSSYMVFRNDVDFRTATVSVRLTRFYILKWQSFFWSIHLLM
jgi:hypothetical protein